MTNFPYCVSYHPCAFYDESGTIVNVASFGGHDEELIEQIKTANQYHGWVSICKIGDVAIGDTWDGEKIVKAPPKPTVMMLPKEILEEDPEAANIPNVVFY